MAGSFRRTHRFDFALAHMTASDAQQDTAAATVSDTVPALNRKQMVCGTALFPIGSLLFKIWIRSPSKVEIVLS
jgi:hypothetical protein